MKSKHKSGEQNTILEGELPPVQTRSATGKSPLSPRRRRLRLTLLVLSALTALGLVAGVTLYIFTRPQQYRPGEADADVTSELTRRLPPDAPKPSFTDVTRQAGLANFRNFAGDRTSQLPEDMGPGVAFGDFDNDGDDDVFLVSAGGALNQPAEQLLSCALFENRGDGSFREFADFPETRIRGMAAAWGDYDGDGFLDLAVSGYHALRLFHNEPSAAGRKFAPDPRLPDLKGFGAGVSWGDFDNDRDLDLYVCGYVQYVENEADRGRGSEQVGTFVPYTLNPASYQPGLNLLFRNNGDGTFTEVAKDLEVTNPTGRSLGALWHDFDDDGWLDLYVANDVSDNVFYHNRRGKFADLSHAAWVADYRSAMGLAAGDYNRDGDDDLFITHWVAQENALYDNLWADFNQAPAGQAKGDPAPQPAGEADRRGKADPNSPLTLALSPSKGEREPPRSRSDAGGLSASAPKVLPLRDETATHNHQSGVRDAKQYPLRFMDLNEQRGLGQIALPFVGWGTEFVDFDADGWLDLVVANGNTLEADGPAPKKLKPQEPFLFWNWRGEFFYNLAPLNSSLSEQHASRGLAVADTDQDGDMDILIAHLGEGVQLLRNDAQTGHWLKVRLRSRTYRGQPLGFGDGAKVIAHLGGVALRRTVSSVSYLSQSSRTLHFGLGAAPRVDRLEVRWLGGETNWFENLEANGTWEITEGDPAPKRLVSTQAQTRLAAAHDSPHATGVPSDKERLIQFWSTQRAAMNALKIETNFSKAIQSFRAALALNPNHEDSHYYLAQCLAATGAPEAALTQLDALTRINPRSHRGFQQWGRLRAIFARNGADLAAAERALEGAHALNPEETGALLVLGEISLLRGHPAKAEQRLAAACRTNPRAVGGFFLRGYLAWKSGDEAASKQLLADTRQALGKEWQPRGATSEGDVKTKQHVEATPLTSFWENWDGLAEPATAFGALDDFLKSSKTP